MKVNNQIINFIKNILFVCLFVCINSRYCYSEQKDSICFEKKALAFYKDSIIPKFYKCNKTKIIFDGYVDSFVTIVSPSCFAKYPISNMELKKRCDYEDESQLNGCSMHEKRSPFFISKNKFNKKTIIPFFKGKRYFEIFQHLIVGDMVYVWIHIYSNHEKYVLSHTKDFFIKMNLKGEVLDWCEGIH